MMTLRPATLADVALLQYWDIQPHVIACDPNNSWDWVADLSRPVSWRKQLLAEINGQPLGFIEILNPAQDETQYWGAVTTDVRAIDIWIGEASQLNKGHGTQMMQLALQQCFAKPSVMAVLVDPLASNSRAQRFYQRIGFEFVEARRFDEDDCYVMQLERMVWAARNKADG